MIYLAYAALTQGSPITLTITTTTFDSHPLVTLALMVNPLLRLPVVTLIARVLLQLHPRASHSYWVDPRWFLKVCDKRLTRRRVYVRQDHLAERPVVGMDIWKNGPVQLFAGSFTTVTNLDITVTNTVSVPCLASPSDTSSLRRPNQSN